MWAVAIVACLLTPERQVNYASCETAWMAGTYTMREQCERARRQPGLRIVVMGAAAQWARRHGAEAGAARTECREARHGA